MITFCEKIKGLFSYNTIPGFTRLLLLISSSVLTLFFYIFVSQEVETTRGYILKNFEQTVNIQQSMIENWFNNHAGQVKTFAELQSTQDGDAEAIKKNIEAVLRNNPEFWGFSFIDVNGWAYEGTNVSDREYFKQSLLGKSYTSDILYGKVTNNPLIVFSSPVFDRGGNVIGVVAGGVRLTTISKTMEQFQFGSTGESYLVDRNGMMVTSTQLASDAAARGMPNTNGRISVKGTYGFEQAIQGKSGSEVYTDYRGQRVFGAFSAIGNPEWIIIAEVDEAEILAPLHKKLSILGLVYLALLAILVYLITAFTRRINRPVFDLVAMANKVESGDYGAVSSQEGSFSKAPQELQYLNKAFISMSQELIATIDELNQVNHLLVEAEDKFRSLVENSLVGVSFLLDGKITYLNPKMEEMIGYTTEEAKQLSSFLEYVHPDDRELVREKLRKRMDGETGHFNYEIRILRKDGSIIDVYILTSTCIINGKKAIFGSMIDISDRKRWESTLEYVSYHDAGTGLYNRAYFELQLNQMATSDRDIGIIMCDVDGLKIINDSLGHYAGDALLKAAAQAISFDDRRIISARIGGDEFALLVWDATEDSMKTLRNNIAANIESYKRSKGSLPLYISQGSCLGKGFRVHEVLRQADDDMYQEKNTNRMKNRERVMRYLEVCPKVYSNR
ncbi:sensor domain-containing diguanylate cyclase [Sporomusa sp.]|uniref:sensor domain-containing diguanylate cyclase n=1 Tax=Sporomusa sp. TaxID=2078658 RepID=UPI002B9E983A|nr:cache domain-containing protein [Sporomusa sp.]HWR42114.1 cache domain-containing protein [Sporomusa sp.]